MRQRRAHFKRKLNSVDKHIRALKEERQNIDAFRTKCTIDMRAKEKLLLSYKLEIERLRQYSGPSVTSSVLAGFMMQYKTVDYQKRIQTAFETCLEEVSMDMHKCVVFACVCMYLQYKHAWIISFTADFIRYVLLTHISLCYLVIQNAQFITFFRTHYTHCTGEQDQVQRDRGRESSHQGKRGIGRGGGGEYVVST